MLPRLPSNFARAFVARAFVALALAAMVLLGSGVSTALHALAHAEASSSSRSSCSASCGDHRCGKDSEHQTSTTTPDQCDGDCSLCFVLAHASTPIPKAPLVLVRSGTVVAMHVDDVLSQPSLEPPADVAARPPPA
jgi:hypothetical protein